MKRLVLMAACAAMAGEGRVRMEKWRELTPEEARDHRPRVVRVDGNNVALDDDSAELPGPVLHSLPPGHGATGLA